MIKAVLIDDERPALKGLEYLLRSHQFVEIAGMFINPLEAIEEIAGIKPHVVFLDINMPQMQGIDAASRILDQCQDTNIVFVTAFDRYAIEAFELHALDYILKPISRERLTITLKRVMAKNQIKQQSEGKKLVISCFGRFQMGWFGEEPVKWRTEKTRELFAFLIHHQGRKVSKDQILEQLWPETPLEKAVHQLHNGIYYIRKTLVQYGIDKSLISISGYYSINLGVVEVDVLLFQQCIGRVSCNMTIQCLEGIETMYVGEYMEGTDWPWADLERERLFRQYGEVVVRLSKAYIEKKEYAKAEKLLLKVFNRNPYEENITELLMQLYRVTGDKTKAARHFAAYTKLLMEDLGVQPQIKLLNIYSSIK
ncbi:response regulator [Phosphitispora sp. TUW77]|uniref:response regulator n=1 Tax=Phosphitispora sp. TUW77 TaxID=3152361 RepID=UPI003AB62633